MKGSQSSSSRDDAVYKRSDLEKQAEMLAGLDPEEREKILDELRLQAESSFEARLRYRSLLSLLDSMLLS